MPDKGHLGAAHGDRQVHDERQRYPGYGGLPPRHPSSGGQPCTPSNPIAEAVLAITRDPCARVEIELLLEEAFRNFQQHVRKPSWIEPPFDSMRSRNIIDETGDVVKASNTDWQDVITGDVMNGEIGILRGFGQGITDASGWDDVHWRIIERQLQGNAVAEIPIPPYIDFTHQLGQVDIMTSIYAMVTGPKTWAVQVYNNSGGPYTVGARIQGWKFSTRAPSDSVGGTIID